jgi:dihydrofolate synthase/folylpolyglutamate synthase
MTRAHPWNYHEAIRYLSARAGYDHGFVANPFADEDAGLERTRHLLALVGNPHHQYPVVHIAGTKGKGSTAAFIAAIAHAAGYRTGLYTSPHLHTFRERFQLNSQPLAPDVFATLLQELASANDQLATAYPALGEATAFELTTALAFLAFARAHVDLAIIEVGLGGRLDATNVVMPTVAAITRIGFDHMHILGNTLDAIAREKAGIIKPYRPVVSAPQAPEAAAVIIATAAQQNAPLWLGDRDWHVQGSSEAFSYAGPEGQLEGLRSSLLGQHQVENAGVAISIAHLLNQQGIDVSDTAIRHGVAAVRWPGRLEVVQERPTIVVDAAHNRESAQALATALRTHFQWAHLTAIIGLARDKDLLAFLTPLLPLCTRLIAVPTHSPRIRTPDEITEVARQLRPDLAVTTAPSVAAGLALARAQADADDLIVATGSLTVVAEAREALGLANADPDERALLS